MGREFIDRSISMNFFNINLNKAARRFKHQKSFYTIIAYGTQQLIWKISFSLVCCVIFLSGVHFLIPASSIHSSMKETKCKKRLNRPRLLENKSVNPRTLSRNKSIKYTFRKTRTTVHCLSRSIFLFKCLHEANNKGGDRLKNERLEKLINLIKMFPRRCINEKHLPRIRGVLSYRNYSSPMKHQTEPREPYTIDNIFCGKPFSPSEIYSNIYFSCSSDLWERNFCEI